VRRAPDTLEPATSWRDQAECANDYPADWWYPIGTNFTAKADTARATTICQRCPVAVDCLEHALTTPEPFGIWGGLTEDQRAEAIHQRRLARRAATRAAA